MRTVRLWIAFTLAALVVHAQVLLRIDEAPPVTVTAESLGKLPRHITVLKDHGKEARFEGVLLHDVLAQNGVDLAKLHGKQLSAYVSATAGDGYKVIYALAEFDPSITDADILLADKRDGQPLAPTEGPFRIIVPHDKRPARSLKMLRELDIVQLEK